jgi:hypothetical protein
MTNNISLIKLTGIHCLKKNALFTILVKKTLFVKNTVHITIIKNLYIKKQNIIHTAKKYTSG